MTKDATALGSFCRRCLRLGLCHVTQGASAPSIGVDQVRTRPPQSFGTRGDIFDNGWSLLSRMREYVWYETAQRSSQDWVNAETGDKARLSDEIRGDQSAAITKHKHVDDVTFPRSILIQYKDPLKVSIIRMQLLCCSCTRYGPCEQAITHISLPCLSCIPIVSPFSFKLSCSHLALD